MRRRHGGETEQQLDHVLHLLLLGTPIADDRAFDLGRRVFDHRQPRFVLRVLVDARCGNDSGIGQTYLANSRNACFNVRSKLPSGVALTAASTAFSESGR